MRSTTSRISATGLAAALGAGLAAALLALMPALKNPEGLTSGLSDMSSLSAFAWAMAFISPLPIMVAAFGFGSIAGFIAALVGAVAVGIVDLRPDAVAALHLDNVATGGLETLVFAVSFGVPSWLLARLAVRPPGPLRPTGEAVARPDEQRLGLLIAVAAGFAAIGAALDIELAINGHGGFQAFIDASSKQVEPLLNGRSPLPQGADPHKIAIAFVWTAMAIMAAAELALLTFNLWLAARIAQMSGLLAVPWPDIPRALRVPRPMAIVLAVALGLSFAGGPIGVLGVIVSGALAMAFAFQGLAVVHAVTRGKKGLRLPLLIIVYLTLMMLMPWSIAFYGVLGLLDAGFAFRDRQKPIVKKIS